MDGGVGRSVYRSTPPLAAAAPPMPSAPPALELDGAPVQRGRASSLASNEERWREALETEY
jgi:hypothetical protein